MLETAKKILKKIESYGYSAYIVGGFVRDYLLQIDSFDVDITTNATPQELCAIFKKSVVAKNSYGSICVVYQKIRFEITTFRQEENYLDHRRPMCITYVDSLEEDLKRRDFKMNTLCMNSDGEIMDLFHGKEDIEKKEISTVGDSFQKMEEDSLRILRAVRFATKLHFSLNKELKEAILKYKYLLKELSYERKKEELDKIFSSSNAGYGISLLLELGLDKELELKNLDKVKMVSDVLGIWASLEIPESYPFGKNEKELLKKIKEVRVKKEIQDIDLYYYGLYVCTIASLSLGKEEKNDLMCRYQKLPIFSRKDIQITSYEIMQLLNRSEGKYLKEIFLDLEEKIVDNKLKNETSELRAYIQKTYLKEGEKSK